MSWTPENLNNLSTICNSLSSVELTNLFQMKLPDSMESGNSYVDLTWFSLNLIKSWRQLFDGLLSESQEILVQNLTDAFSFICFINLFLEIIITFDVVQHSHLTFLNYVWLDARMAKITFIKNHPWTHVSIPSQTWRFLNRTSFSSLIKIPKTPQSKGFQQLQ